MSFLLTSRPHFSVIFFSSVSREIPLVSMALTPEFWTINLYLNWFTCATHVVWEKCCHMCNSWKCVCVWGVSPLRMWYIYGDWGLTIYLVVHLAGWLQRSIWAVRTDSSIDIELPCESHLLNWFDGISGAPHPFPTIQKWGMQTHGSEHRLSQLLGYILSDNWPTNWWFRFIVMHTNQLFEVLVPFYSTFTNGNTH